MLLHILSIVELTTATTYSAKLPMISARLHKGIINRDRVRQFQIQSIFNTMNTQDAFTREIVREVTPSVTQESERDNDEHGRDENRRSTTSANTYSEQMPWDIVKRQVPFKDLLERNSVSKIAPMNVHSSSEKGVGGGGWRTLEKRGLLRPSEDVNEEVQPVEIVKIKKLVIQDGIIRDQNIVEKAMFV